jgi:hypothetical protein
MDQVVTAFVKLPKKYNQLAKGVVEWSTDDTGTTYRLSLFYAFWAAIKETYPAAWEKGVEDRGQLFYKVALINLQDYLLEQLKSILTFIPESPFSSPGALSGYVKKALERLPEEFFLREWKEKNLDTRSGHSFFLRSIQEVIEADGKNLGNRRLFKGTN